MKNPILQLNFHKKCHGEFIFIFSIFPENYVTNYVMLAPLHAANIYFFFLTSIYEQKKLYYLIHENLELKKAIFSVTK